jgi:hypothetical protein
MKCIAAVSDTFKVIRKTEVHEPEIQLFLHNRNWLIIGLDTAYWGYNQSFLYEDRYIANDRLKPQGTAQRNWLVDLLSKLEHAHKRLMILTHHAGFDVNVGMVIEKDLLREISGVIGNTRDCLWYRGHVHGGIAYKPIQLAENTFLRTRCVGMRVFDAPFGDLSTYGTSRYSIGAGKS